MNPKSVLIVGIKGHIVCLRKEDGSEVWRTRLRGSEAPSIARDGDQVFGASQGYLYALNLADGKIQWVNGLPKLGFGTCVMGTPSQGALAALNIIAQQQVAIAAAAGASATAAAASSG